MGCISSKADINDHHPNVFNVMNLDDVGQDLRTGNLEITETDLILYQRGRAPMRWPIRCLRRYGFESDVFSFESGRRCPSGPGIYAFRSSRAEQLFNLLQAHIQQSRSSGGDDAVSWDFPVVTPTSAPGTLLASSVPRGSLASSSTLMDSPLEPNYLEPVRTSRSITLRQANGSSRLSGGPLSPQTPSPISVLPSPASNSVYYANDIVIAEAAESVVNNNVRTTSAGTDSPAVTMITTTLTCKSNGDLVNGTAVTPATPTSPVAYMNLLSPTTPTSPYQPYDTETNYARLDALLKSEQLHLYMNVEPENTKEKEELDLPTTPQCNNVVNNVDYDRHCYANLGIGPGELDVKPRPILLPSPTPIAPTETPPAEHKAPIRQVNYIVLDLERGTDASSQTTPLSPAGSVTSAAPVDSPRPTQTALGYATIDFDKTAALCHSVKPKIELDNEGSRKTRHNSTIHELPVKQSNSSVSD